MNALNNPYRLLERVLEANNAGKTIEKGSQLDMQIREALKVEPGATPKDERTLAQLASEALDVQGACNLSGLVLGWGRSISRLRELLPDIGTDLHNTHPINILWADKIGQLTSTQLIATQPVGDALGEVSKLAKG